MSSLCFSLNGKLLSSTAGREVFIWDFKTSLAGGGAPLISAQSPVPVVNGAFLASHPVLLVGGGAAEHDHMVY